MKMIVLVPARLRARKAAGFSLVITILMMILLSILALGSLSLSTITLRASEAGAAMATAKANARLAVVLAIGDLQKYAGQDQRATAPSDQLTLSAQKGNKAKDEQVNQKHWLGVWPTTQASAGKPGFLVGRYGGGSDGNNYLVDLREPTIPASGDNSFDKNRADFADKGNLAWLVSNPGTDADFSPKTYAKGVDSVVIFGQGWEADPQLKDSQVAVPLVKVDNGTKIPGAYGYWVSDENMKANLAVVSRQGTGAMAKAVSQTAPIDLVDSSLAGHQDLLRGQNAAVSKLATYASASLLPLASSGDPARIAALLKKYGNDLTVRSTGLLTNPQTGGFQQDLSAFLAMTPTITSANFSTSLSAGFDKDALSGAPGLKAGDPIVYGTRHANTSPRFGAIKAWADLAKQVSGSGPSGSINVQVPAFRNLAGQNPNTAGLLPDITQVGPQAVHPIMTECSLGWDFTDWTQSGAHGLRAHIFPKVVLWNPYNVTINAAPYLVLMKMPYYGSVQINQGPNEGGVVVDQNVYNTTSTNYRFYFLPAMGAPTQGFAGFVTEPTAIPPGQALVFTASPIGRGDTLDGVAMPFNATDYAKNILTCRQQPAGQNFFKEIRPGTSGANDEVFWLQKSKDPTDPTKIISTKVAGLPPVYSAKYGFSGDSNSFYSSSSGKADQYILKTMPPGGVPSSIAWTDALTASYPAVQFMVAQTAATNGYDKWWSAQNNQHGSNASHAFAAFSKAATPPRLWRRGLKLRWFNDVDEYNACNQAARGTSPFNVNWTSEYNLRGGLVHTAWLGANGNFGRDTGDRGGWQAADPGPYVFMWSPKRLGDDPAILSGSNYCVCPFGPTNMAGGSVSFPLFEIPRSDESVVSLAQFQNAQLSYQTYHTSYVVGYSEQEPRSERAATVIRPGKGGVVTANAADDIGSNIWNVGHDILIQAGSGGASTQNNEILLYDMAFEVNHRLFDNYFLSGIPSGWDTKVALPNDRLRFMESDTRTAASVKSRLSSGDYQFNQAASLLGNEGAFNVNSTSVAAWTAHLSGLRNLGRDALGGATATSGSWYSRMQYPVLGSNAAGQTVSNPAAWAGIAALSDQDLSTLATAIVQEVKLRGPFLSLSDFVNRRLVEPPAGVKDILYEDPSIYSLETTGKIGTLGAAILRAKLNTGLAGSVDPSASASARFGTNERNFTASDVSSGYFVYGSQPLYKTSGLPGSLSQGDLLCALAPTLTARGDTFTIRGYGEARDSTGQSVTARAWCEVTVQRVPDYVDGTNDPSVRALVPASSDPSDPTLQSNPSLTAANRLFGRRFNVVAFRWLQNSEV